jgi:hypothetical protein
VTSEEQEVEMQYGMRGGIPSNRMEQIHLALPYAIPLSDILPQLADPIGIGILFGEPGKTQATVMLSDGWHLLNQARLALIEADACTIFYEEIKSNPDEAHFHCRYYLDDAALRLCSSCEHMVQSIFLYWNLSTSPSKKGARDGALTRVLRAAQESKNAEVRKEIPKLLKPLRSSKSWKACAKHRNDWVHNRIPAISERFSQITFKEVDADKAFPPEFLKYTGFKQGQKCKLTSLGIGTNISVLRKTIRNAYCELFLVFEGLAKLLAKENQATNASVE